MFGTTVGVLRKQMQRWPDKEFIVGSREHMTYVEFYHRVNRLAHWLTEHGVRRGDNVGLLMYNCPELYIGILAVHRLGAVANLWNFRLRGRDIDDLTRQVGAKAILCSSEFLPTLDPGPGTVVLSDGAREALPASAHSFAEISAMPQREPSVADPEESDLASVIYTSGTTGRPKGAAYTHQTQLLSAIQYCLEMGLDLGRRGLTAAPVIHGGATNFFFAYLFIGGTFIDAGKYSAERILELAINHGATELMAVPTQIMELLRVAEERAIPAAQFSALRLIRTAGSPYPKSMVERVHKTFGCHLLNTFGMTENCANVTTMHSGYDPEEAWTTIGKETYFWNAGVAEIGESEARADKRIVPPGRGQLIVRGPQNITQYYLSEKAPLYGDGWLFARDVVDLAPSGYMQILDRVDETILTGGEIVYPQEVEMFLEQHPSIVAAAAIGLPDPKWGEIVVALIVRNSQTLDAEAVERHCLESEELARYKRPRRVIFVDALPQNVFGKLERYKLREQYRALPE